MVLKSHLPELCHDAIELPMKCIAALALLVLAPASFVWGCREDQESARKTGRLVVELATLRVPNGGELEFELGTLFAPENRAERKSRSIRVGFARFKTEARTGAPPIFLLPGGPADSYLTDLKPNSLSMSLVKRLLDFRAIGDVVLVDQRRFSERGEVLKYRYQRPGEPLDQPASVERATAIFADMARAAVKEFESKGVDLRGYTVKECADDVDDLAEALGYDRIILVGASFGSQWSFAVMRRHPERVARALLSGVEPLDAGYDLPSHILAAIQRMWREAEQDSRLKPYLPPGGLMAAWRSVLDRLEREPARVPLKTISGATDSGDTTITLGREDLHRMPALLGADGPALMLSLYHGRYESWAAACLGARRSRSAEFPLIAALIDTSLGASPQRLDLLRNDPGSTLLDRWNSSSFLATAEIWPSLDMGDDFRAAVINTIPVVFVHGDWDTQTPIENMLQIALYFRNGHVLVVERGGHGVINQLAQHLPETMSALLEFVKTGNATGVPTRVAVPAPKFRVPNLPPPDR
jgi:pimeloyl-ACP methyl ester carboxylesterase